MNKKEEKVCRFLVTNKIANKDLTLDFNEGILMYKDFEWDLNSKYTEVEVREYEELVIEDCDQYKLIIDWDGTIEVETPEEKEGSWLSLEEAIGEIDRLLEVNKDLAKKCELLEQTNKIDKFLKSYGVGDLDEAIENFKSMKEYSDLCNKVYLNTMLTGVR
nr:MAG TPA: hypothetical protein [Caudoviricetes sp.]